MPEASTLHQRTQVYDSYKHAYREFLLQQYSTSSAILIFDTTSSLSHQQQQNNRTISQSTHMPAEESRPSQARQRVEDGMAPICCLVGLPRQRSPRHLQRQHGGSNVTVTTRQLQRDSFNTTKTTQQTQQLYKRNGYTARQLQRNSYNSTVTTRQRQRGSYNAPVSPLHSDKHQCARRVQYALLVGQSFENFAHIGQMR